MATSSIITIGREYGSGGRYVGRLLSEKLGIPFYDKEILQEASRASGISQELIEDHDEEPTRSLLYSLVTGFQARYDTGSMYMDMPLNHKIFLAQFDAIRAVAEKGPCVIVGRCGDYVLRDNPNLVSCFIKADMKSRIERAVQYYGMDPEKAEENLRRADRRRASYYNYYATSDWGSVKNYHICLDTGAIGVAGAVDVLEKFIEAKEHRA